MLGFTTEDFMKVLTKGSQDKYYQWCSKGIQDMTSEIWNELGYYNDYSEYCDEKDSEWYAENLNNYDELSEENKERYDEIQETIENAIYDECHEKFWAELVNWSYDNREIVFPNMVKVAEFCAEKIGWCDQIDFVSSFEEYLEKNAEC